MNTLRSSLNVADKNIVAESNYERLDRSFAFALNPSLVGGVPTAALGGPTAGARFGGELWADALCAVWRCTAAGTPGTWGQITPAVVATADRPAAPPAGYWIVDTDEHFKGYYWDGAAWTAI